MNLVTAIRISIEKVQVDVKYVPKKCMSPGTAKKWERNIINIQE